MFHTGFSLLGKFFQNREISGFLGAIWGIAFLGGNFGEIFEILVNQNGRDVSIFQLCSTSNKVVSDWPKR